MPATAACSFLAVQGGLNPKCGGTHRKFCLCSATHCSCCALPGRPIGRLKRRTRRFGAGRSTPDSLPKCPVPAESPTQVGFYFISCSGSRECLFAYRVGSRRHGHTSATRRFHRREQVRQCIRLAVRSPARASGLSSARWRHHVEGRETRRCCRHNQPTRH